MEFASIKTEFQKQATRLFFFSQKSRGGGGLKLEECCCFIILVKNIKFLFE